MNKGCSPLAEAIGLPQWTCRQPGALALNSQLFFFTVRFVISTIWRLGRVFIAQLEFIPHIVSALDWNHFL